MIEIPIVDGGVSAEEWAKLLPGVWFYDPAFMTTAAAESSITFIDGEEGKLEYRGYPIEPLAEHSREELRSGRIADQAAASKSDRPAIRPGSGRRGSVHIRRILIRRPRHLLPALRHGQIEQRDKAGVDRRRELFRARLAQTSEAL